MNKSIYFNAEWMEALKCMVPEIREKVITAIINYQITGEIPQMTSGKTVFMLLKLEVDRRNRRLAKAKEARKAKKAKTEIAKEHPLEPSMPSPGAESASSDTLPQPKTNGSENDLKPKEGAQNAVNPSSVQSRVQVGELQQESVFRRSA